MKIRHELPALPRSSAFTFLLPLLFILPEVIDLGFIFIRWDHLLLIPIIIALTQQLLSKLAIGQTPLRKKTAFLVISYIGFSIFQVFLISADEEIIGAIKYSAWPVKVIIWAIGATALYRHLHCGIKDLYQFTANLAILVLAMQLLELLFHPFRDLLFTYYPVAATERLADLLYRARGPFSGYDTASIFFASAGVVINEIHRHDTSTSTWKKYSYITICAAGALIAARTGFSLFIVYLLAREIITENRRSRFVLLTIVFVAGVFAGTLEQESDTESLLGRYGELVSAISEGDLMQISSVQGTFHMNEVLQVKEGDYLLGSGLTAGTTADQLYFKYFYMYGAFGIVVWLATHTYLLFLTYPNRKSSRSREKTAAFIICIGIAIAHLKGGNYFFSARLGEFIALVLMLAVSARSARDPIYERIKS